jgi:hypothetical protein
MKSKDGSRPDARTSWDKQAKFFAYSPIGCVLSFIILPLFALGMVFTLESIVHLEALGFVTGLIFLTFVGVLVGIKHKATVRYLKATQFARDEEAREIDEKLLTGWSGSTYFLYLRPFETTGKMNTIVLGTIARSSRAGPENLSVSIPGVEFEALLRAALESWGPLIGLGAPGEQLGAGRLPVEDSKWQAAVRRLVRNADTVFIIPGGTRGALWEFRHLLKRGYLRRTVVVMPPKALDLDMVSLWSEARTALAPAGVKLPEYSATGAFILFAKNGKPERISKMPAPLDESNLREALKELI